MLKKALVISGVLVIACNLGYLLTSFAEVTSIHIFCAIFMVYGVAINATIKASKKAMATSPHIFLPPNYFIFSLSISSINFSLSSCLPPSNSVASHILNTHTASFTVKSSAPIANILLLLCNLAYFAVYSL